MSQGGHLIEAVKVEEAFRAADKKPAHNFHYNGISSNDRFKKNKLITIHKFTWDVLYKVMSDAWDSWDCSQDLVDSAL